MLPDLRFVIGAGLATTLLVVTGFGVVATLRLAHQAKVGPLASSRALAYADQTDWNQFQDPTAARRFEDMTRPIASESAAPSLEPPAEVATAALEPVAPSPISEPTAQEVARVQPPLNLTTDVAPDSNVAGIVPQDGNAPPSADDHAARVDLEPVTEATPAATTSVPLPDVVTATAPSDTPSINVAALDITPSLPASIPPATTLPASTEPVTIEPVTIAPAAIAPATTEPAVIEPMIAAPAPIVEPPAASEIERVASIPVTTLPGIIIATGPLPPLPKAAPTRRQMASAPAQARHIVHRSRLFAARARAIRAARIRAARARQAAQQPFASTGFPVTTGPFNNRRSNGFGSPGGN
jgi:hypothetical protein